MPPHKTFFYAGLFFLIGVLVKSIRLNFQTLLVFLSLFFLLILFFVIKRDRRYIYFIFLSSFMFFGAIYYQWDLNRFHLNDYLLNEEEFIGIIDNNPIVTSSFQELYLRVDGSRNGKILIRTNIYPKYKYQDRILIKGKTADIPYKSYKEYLTKEGVTGVVYYPKIEIISLSDSSSLKNKLFSIRNSIGDSLKRLLPPLESSLMKGILLGETKGMDDDFRQALSNSGTSHLVALSGLHVTILMTAFMSVLLTLFPRGISLFFTFIFMFGFVLMTGASPSIIRATLMGALATLAEQSGRLYSVKNSIMTTALLMVILNPQVLAFDIGFQLSFLALLGIIYLKPVLRDVFKMSEEPGFFGWRENFLTTTSAQIFVAPVLILNFNQISLTSIISNLLIIEFIPITMGAGFLLFLFSKISFLLSFLFSYFVWFILSFEAFLIDLFGRINPSFSFDLNPHFIPFYYLIMFLVIYHFIKSKKIISF